MQIWSKLMYLLWIVYLYNNDFYVIQYKGFFYKIHPLGSDNVTDCVISTSSPPMHLFSIGRTANVKCMIFKTSMDPLKGKIPVKSCLKRQISQILPPNFTFPTYYFPITGSLTTGNLILLRPVQKSYFKCQNCRSANFSKGLIV